MPENWKSYFCNVNDKLASIALDLGLRPDAPMPEKPWLLWVWIYLLSPGPERLTTSTEAPMIWKIEEKLDETAREICAAVPCGRITTDGKREVYFYGKANDGFEAAVRDTMSHFPEYQFDFGSQHEPDWNQYLNVLYPSDESMEIIKNIDLLEEFERQGDTLKTAREVTHWIYFACEADRESFCRMVTPFGYEVERLPLQGGNRTPLGVTASRAQSIALTEIDKTVLELLRLARTQNGFYDGWEAQVIVD